MFSVDSPDSAVLLRALLELLSALRNPPAAVYTPRSPAPSAFPEAPPHAGACKGGNPTDHRGHAALEEPQGRGLSSCAAAQGELSPRHSGPRTIEVIGAAV